MAAPVKATASQVVEANPPSTEADNQGSYPAEISREQFDWLQERAAAHRRRWEEHAHSMACNQKS
jgi:hypothetical protein